MEVNRNGDENRDEIHQEWFGLLKWNVYIDKLQRMK